jgi:hypothetical protein
MSTIPLLFDSLQKRLRPEDVAELILSELDASLTTSERHLLQRGVAGSLKRSIYQMTSMLQDFRRPVPPIKQSRKARELFNSAYTLSDEDCADLTKVTTLVRHLSLEVYKTFGANDFKTHRLNRLQRNEAGLELSRRRYNKLFRFLQRFEKKLETYHTEQRKYRATRIAKSSLATDITYSDFSASTDAACFIAYFTARSNRRSVFTNQSQDRHYDQIAEMLLKRFKANPAPEGWRAIAHVMPDAETLEHVSEKDKMELLTKWLVVLKDIAELLERTWEKSQFNRHSMIVKRGDDSSTWNALAGAWNAARQSWIGLMFALGLEEELEKVCFGKVMRLMAADVAAWHRRSGGTLEPDTLVWAELPAPWEVFSSEVVCTLEDVKRVCTKHNVDPVKKGWIFPRHERKAVPFKPTPELVHGVIVEHPQLATILKKAGWFSGKILHPLPQNTDSFAVKRDETGAALGVEHLDDPSNKT